MAIPGSTSLLSYAGPCFVDYGFADIGLVFPYLLALNLNPAVVFTFSVHEQLQDVGFILSFFPVVDGNIFNFDKEYAHVYSSLYFRVCFRRASG